MFILYFYCFYPSSVTTSSSNRHELRCHAETSVKELQLASICVLKEYLPLYVAVRGHTATSGRGGPLGVLYASLDSLYAGGGKIGKVHTS